jgi:hypothetical protein
MQQMARYEIGLQPAAAVAQGPGPGPAHRIICKPEKDLKPIELTADITPVEFAYWVNAFEAYHAGSHMGVTPCAVQQAFFKACVHPVLYNHIKSNIVSGAQVTHRHGADERRVFVGTFTVLPPARFF